MEGHHTFVLYSPFPFARDSLSGLAIVSNKNWSLQLGTGEKVRPCSQCRSLLRWLSKRDGRLPSVFYKKRGCWLDCALLDFNTVLAIPVANSTRPTVPFCDIAQYVASEMATTNIPTRRQTPALRGRVYGNGLGHFHDLQENLADDPEQLPQFLPRTQWPQDHDAGGLYRHENRFHKRRIHWWPRANHPINDEGAAIRDKVRRAYPQLKPMPPFQNERTRDPNDPRNDNLHKYEDSVWLDHVAILHGILMYTIGDRRRPHYLDNAEIHQLLTTISYGMHQSMAWLEAWSISGHPAPRTIKHESRASHHFVKQWVPAFDMEMYEGAFSFGSTEPGWEHQMRTRIHGNRYIVVPICQFEMHWMMTIFDRKAGHLYIFDAVKADRETRVEAAVHRWAQFWDRLGFPYHFQYFAPAVSVQAGSWECGLIGIHWVTNTLRHRVGGTEYRADDDTIAVKDFNLRDHDHANYPLETASIPVHDWVPTDVAVLDALPPGTGLSLAKSVEWICLYWKIICANELGIWEARRVLEPHATSSPVPRSVTANPLERSDSVVPPMPKKASHKRDRLCAKLSKLITGFGGKTFAHPPTAAALAMVNAKHWETCVSSNAFPLEAGMVTTYTMCGVNEQGALEIRHILDVEVDEESSQISTPTLSAAFSNWVAKVAQDNPAAVDAQVHRGQGDRFPPARTCKRTRDHGDAAGVDSSSAHRPAKRPCRKTVKA
ncbi:uncharacterized protein F5Z01DRAFT_649436 [Emericellopsis atlantica]|uniref:Ubiquitin-like protease family profile domain-containing protein n=1 Tax=Emericellopsis atlantica TaxID=2614577 RepID=A0A9P7ZQ07_9HYPO|nr:uncharacterized protein F5Z01DRAFT_649436 [Emericellopsis atlantica]KAG9256194.1 hypothetical protein F5Z01DRAFT_649436 [Emericellopsis atlantica]